MSKAFFQAVGKLTREEHDRLLKLHKAVEEALNRDNYTKALEETEAIM